MSGTLCLVGALFPPTPVTPRLSNAVLAGVATLVAGYLAWRRDRLPRPAAHVLLVGFTVGVWACVANAGTEAGAVAAGAAIVWVCLFAALRLGGRAARAHWGLAATGLALALAHSVGGGHGWSAFVLIALSALVAGEMLARANAELQTLSRTDTLTGVSNRRGLEVEGERLLRRVRRDGIAATVAVVDLDGFKGVNDAHGHAAGDRLLKLQAAQWLAGLRLGDVIARTGGDEFVMLLPETTPSEATDLLARLREVSASRWTYGLAQVRADDDLGAVLLRADVELYAAKQARCDAVAPPAAG